MMSIKTVINVANGNPLARSVKTVSSSGKLRMFVVQVPHRIDNQSSRMPRIGIRPVRPCLDRNCIHDECDALVVLIGHRLAGLRFWWLLSGDPAKCSIRFDENRVRSKYLVRSGCDLWCSRKQFWPIGEQTSETKRFIIVPSNVPFSAALKIARSL